MSANTPDLLVDTSKAVVETPHARAASRRLERVLPYLLVAPVMNIYIFVVLILPILIKIYYSFLTREREPSPSTSSRTATDNYIQVFTQKYIMESLAFTDEKK